MADNDGSPLRGLVSGLKSLSELEITTVVGNVMFDVVDGEQGKPSARLRSTEAGGEVNLKGCFTRIDMVAGDMQNLVHEDFLGDNSQVLEFHRKQVTTGREIVRANVDMLVRLGREATGALGNLLGLPNESEQNEPDTK